MIAASANNPVRPLYLRASLLATPISATVAVALLAMAILPLVHRPIYPMEMLLAAAINVIVGLLAVAPMTLLIGCPPVPLLRCAVFANLIRLVGMAFGAVLAVWLGPADWDKTALLLWLVFFYFALLIAESIVGSWVIKHAVAGANIAPE